VNLMVGYGVGGTDDVWARLVGKYLGDHIPGHPFVVVTNVPGAGSLVLANRIFNSAPRDRTNIGVINRGVLSEPLLGGMGIYFDPKRLAFIGSPDLDTPVCMIRNDAPVKTLADLSTRQYVVGATGSGSDSETYPEVFKVLLGLKIKIVQGYPGSRDVLLATERGEVQGGCFSYATVERSPLIRDHTARLLFQAALQPDDRMPGVPVVNRSAGTGDAQPALDLFLQRTLVGRPFVMGPGVPAQRIAALQAAFADTMRDPRLVSEADRLGLHIHYVAPVAMQKILAGAYAEPPAVVAALKTALGR
jgi:tripartite-type tricarboxylate transporter receptor subunit TctC